MYFKDYHYGTKIELTGRVFDQWGAEVEEFVYLEGHKKGEKGCQWTKAYTDKYDEKERKIVEEMRAGHKRLQAARKALAS